MNGTGPGRASRARGLAAAAVAAVCTLPLAVCGLFGSKISPSVMSVTSGAFLQNIMPSRYTCAGGKAQSPPLGWTGMPAGTKSLALVLDDSAAPITPYVYWIVFNISPETSDILEGQLPPGARRARNSAGQAAYAPPCPGSRQHDYRFTVYALDSMLDLPAGTSLLSAWNAIAAAAIGRGRMTVSAAS